MKKLIYLTTIILLSLEIYAQDYTSVFLTENPYPCYDFSELVFQDEFNGINYNSGFWSPLALSPAPFDRQNADGENLVCVFNAFKKEENVEVSNGSVKLWVKDEYFIYDGVAGDLNQDGINDILPEGTILDDVCPDIKSGDPFSFVSANTADGLYGFEGFTHGKFEIRAKINSAHGLWPAFWLVGGGYEIDIFEFFDSRKKMTTTLYGYDECDPSAVRQNREFADLSQDFHIYTCEWTPHYIKTYMDNEVVFEIYKYQSADGTPIHCSSVIPQGVYSEVKNFPPDDTYLGIILSTRVWNNQVLTNGNENAYEIDYIRVYQTSDACSELVPPELVLEENQAMNIFSNKLFSNITLKKG